MKNLKQNIPLKNYSNYKIGGPAAFFLDVSSVGELTDGLREWSDVSRDFSKDQKKIFILSGGSNVLIDDGGFNGLVIHNSIKLIEKKENVVNVGSGLLVKDFLNYCIENSLSGFEWAGGLPGTIGGAVRGNAGAFGGETKDLLISIESIDIDTLERKERDKDQCAFDYRTSIFKKDNNNEFIISAKFNLKKGERQEIKDLIKKGVEHRELKHPMDVPSLGSTFKNIPFNSLSLELQQKYKDYVKNDPIPVLPVAKLLHLANLKKERVGDAMVSEKHPNFIVNLGNAKSQDVKSLINFIKTKIKEEFGILLEEEIAYLPR